MRIRFSLRTLLMLLTLASVLLGWIVIERKDARREVSIANKLVKEGFYVRFAYSIFCGPYPVSISNADGTPGPVVVTDSHIQQIASLSRLKYLSFCHWKSNGQLTGITDRDLVPIRSLQVRYLSIASPNLTGAGIALLSDMNGLVIVNLFATNIDVTDLAVLQRLRSLQELRIFSSVASPDEIRRLQDQLVGCDIVLMED